MDVLEYDGSPAISWPRSDAVKRREWIAQVQAGQPLVSPPAPWECAPNVPNPLLAALRLGRLDAVGSLLQAGWDINAGGSLITFCLDRPEKVEFLLSRGARLDVADARDKFLAR